MTHSDQTDMQLTLDGREEPTKRRRRRLTKAQIEGAACAVCGRESGHMIPLRAGPKGQLFAHLDCAGRK